MFFVNCAEEKHGFKVRPKREALIDKVKAKFALVLNAVLPKQAESKDTDDSADDEPTTLTAAEEARVIAGRTPVSS